MSENVGNRIPAPLRFELGAQQPAGVSRALLLATVDADGAPRIAVLSMTEVSASDDRRLVLEVRERTATCENLRARGKASVWCVLDAAAYTVKGAAKARGAPTEAGWQPFEIDVESVWRDFEPSAPMIAGPTYRQVP